MSKSNEYGHSAEILMWLEVPVRGVLDEKVTLGQGKQVLVTIIDGKEFRSEGFFVSVGDVDAGLADMAIKELQGQLVEVTAKIEALNKELLEIYGELLMRRKELDEARRLAAEEKELRQQAHAAIHEARRSAEEFRNAYLGTDKYVHGSVWGCDLPWEGEK